MSVDKASERAALATGHTMATWSNVLVAVRAQKGDAIDDLVEDDDESEADSGMEEMVEDSSDDCMSDTMRPSGQQTHFN